MMSNKIASRFSLTVILVAFISPTDQGPSKWYDKLLSVQQIDNIQEGIFASIERLIGIEDESEMKAKYNANVEENKVKEIKNWWDLLPRSKDIPTVHYTPIKMRDGAYQMNQYMPESFLKFWKDILKIDLHMLKKSFAASRDDESKRMRPLGDDHAGKSGQSLFLTHDHIWLVKTVSAPELLKLAEMAERYYQHWAELKKSTHSSSSSHASSPTDKHNSYTHNSLITVYMGCYTYVEKQTEVAHIIIMKNLAPKLSGEVITLDIKGIMGRIPEEKKKTDEKDEDEQSLTFTKSFDDIKRKLQEVENPEDKIEERLGRKKVENRVAEKKPDKKSGVESYLLAEYPKGIDFIFVGPSGEVLKNADVRAALTYAADFLLAEEVVDYSLLLVISKKESKEHCTYNSFLGAKRGDLNPRHRFQVRLAVIDTLIQYNSFKKMAESNLKGALRYLTGSDPSQRTIVPPKEYYERFLKFTIGDHEHDGHVVAKDPN